jgi:hypothetical protein
VPTDDRQETPPPARREAPPRTFPREAYVFGWLTIGVVVVMGIRALVTGVLGTGIILIGLVPVMIWMMYIRPRGPREKGPRG